MTKKKFESEISLEEDENYHITGVLYKISNQKKLSKKQLIKEWEELFSAYEELEKEVKDKKKNFIKLLEKVAMNMNFKTYEIENFSKPIIRKFIKKFKEVANEKN